MADDETRIIIIPPGDYPIYQSPPPDHLSPGRQEEQVGFYWSDQNLGVQVIRAQDVESKAMNTICGRRTIHTDFPPHPEIHPHLTGEVRLCPRERMVVREYTCDEDGTGHAEIIQHTRYQPKWSERIRNVFK